MSSKNSVEIDLGFPVYGLRFVNNNTVLACGGGGEGKNGIPNKITAIRCSFNVSDKKRRLQKFREITLPSNEDSPMCIDYGKSPSDDNIKYSIFVGCNQSTDLIKSMSINNNLRKYVYNDEEHLEFSDAVQFDDNLSTESIGEYPKIVQTARDSSVGGLMTSRIPSEIFIFNPDSLELNLRFKPSSPSEIKDFHINPEDGGQTLTYVTASYIETISTHSGNLIASSLSADRKSANVLSKYFFSKIRYVNSSKVLVTAAKKNGKGSAIIEYDLNLKKVTREKIISSKIKGIVAIDVSSTAGLVAVAGNDFSISLLRLSDLKLVKCYTKLHAFAVTCLSFSPNGKKLATGSAANSLNVLQVPSSSGGFLSFIGTLFKYAFLTIFVGLLSIYIQKAHEKGDLDEIIELSRIYGGDALTLSRHYAKIGLELSGKYGAEYYQHAQKYGKIAYGVAKDKGLEGFDLLKEKLAKKEDSPPSILTANWTENAEKTTTASTVNEQSTGGINRVKKSTADVDTDSNNEAIPAVQVETPAASVDSKEPPQSGRESEPSILSKASSALSSVASEVSPVVESVVPEASSFAQSVIYENSPVDSFISKASSSAESVISEASPSVGPVISEASPSVESVISVDSPSAESVAFKVAPIVESVVPEVPPSVASVASEAAPSADSIAEGSSVDPESEIQSAETSPSVVEQISESSDSESIASDAAQSLSVVSPDDLDSSLEQETILDETVDDSVAQDILIASQDDTVSGEIVEDKKISGEVEENVSEQETLPEIEEIIPEAIIEEDIPEVIEKSIPEVIIEDRILTSEEPSLNLTEQEPKEQIQFQEQADIKPPPKVREPVSDPASEPDQTTEPGIETVDSTTSALPSSDVETPENLQEIPLNTVLEDSELSASAQDSAPSDVSPKDVPSLIEETPEVFETVTQDSLEVSDTISDAENPVEPVVSSSKDVNVESVDVVSEPEVEIEVATPEQIQEDNQEQVGIVQKEKPAEDIEEVASDIVQEAPDIKEIPDVKEVPAEAQDSSPEKESVEKAHAVPHDEL